MLWASLDCYYKAIINDPGLERECFESFTNFIVSTISKYRALSWEFKHYLALSCHFWSIQAIVIFQAQ